MARAIWSGTISFGLVNIPIKLVTAVREKKVHFHMLTPEGDCRLRRKLYCPDTGKEYDFKNTSRGFEIAPDQYVIIEEEEFERIRPEAGRTIDISEFVKIEEIDPIYYDRTYYLVPDQSGAKAYQLLLQAMSDAGRVAIARFVMRQRQHLAALRPSSSGVLMLHTMYYADEVVSVDDLNVPDAKGAVAKKELQVASRLIDALAEKFEPEKHHDEYREQLEAMIEAKAEGEEVVAPAVAAEEAPRVINIMDALQKSLAEAEKQSKKPRRRKTA